MMNLIALAGYGRDILRRVSSHPVLKAAASYISVTLVVKGAAFIKEVVLAAVFGVSGAMDAYLMALAVIAFPGALLLNSVQSVYIRESVLIREKSGDEEANRFLFCTVGAILAVMLAVLAVWLSFLPEIVGIVGRGFAVSKRALVADCVYGLTIYYFLNGVNVIGYGSLQARKDFTPGALIPIVIPLVTLLIVLIMGGDLRALIEGLTLGMLVETVLVYRRLASSGLRLPRPYWKVDDSLRHLALGSAVLIPNALLSALLPMIEQAIASGLDNGVVSSLAYASRLPTMINNVLVTAVGVTVLPHFSKMLANREGERCRRFFIRYAALLAVVGTVIATVGFLFSEPFVRVAFQRGAFGTQDTLMVAALQRAYMLQVPAALVVTLSASLLVANAAFRAVSVVAIGVVPITGMAQWWLSNLWGPVGVACGASIGMSISALCLSAWALLSFGRVRHGP